MQQRRFYILVITVMLAGIGIWLVARYQFGGQALAPLPIASGQFHQVAHKGKGTATIYQLPGGKRVLSLTDFRTSVGQDLQVYVIAATDAFENETVENAGFISLGRLQSCEGDQSYDLPAEVDLSKYKAVTIWSAKYRVNFTTAPLNFP